MSIELKLRRLEKRFGIKKGMVPGTVLTRVCLQDGGIGWTLGIGRMSMPKVFFTGKTINDVLKQADQAVKKGQTEPKTVEAVLGHPAFADKVHKRKNGSKWKNSGAA